MVAEMSGLGVHYDLGEGHPLLGRRMPDLDLETADGAVRVFSLLHDAPAVLINFEEPGGIDITLWADRLRLVNARYDHAWELPVIGAVAAPTAVFLRPDGYVAWVRAGNKVDLRTRSLPHSDGQARHREPDAKPSATWNIKLSAAIPTHNTDRPESELRLNASSTS